MAENIYNNFLGLPPELTSWEKAKVAVIQAPLENTTSFQHGTAQGPQAFLKASQQVELYDIASGLDFSSIGAVTLESPDFSSIDSQGALAQIEKDVRRALEKNLWPITLGGEHTISFAPIKVLKEKYADLSVLQIDAHADMRETYEGSKWSHACVMKRVTDIGVPVTGVGIRNYSADEAELLKNPKNLYTVIHDTDIEDPGAIEKLLSSGKLTRNLSKNVYITVDIDGFDPSETPGTGTPEPNGLRWQQGIALLKHVFKNHNVVGVDINEIMPQAHDARTEFFAAKLAYRMLGYKFFAKQTLV